MGPHRSLGHYLDLCEFFGWWDAAEVLERRIAASPKGRDTRCQTPDQEMVAALLTAQVKASAQRMGTVPPCEEGLPEPEEAQQEPD